MNRTKLIREVAHRTGVSGVTTRLVIEAAEAVIRESLFRREGVRFEGFGVIAMEPGREFVCNLGDTPIKMRGHDTPVLRLSHKFLQELRHQLATV